MAQMPPFRWEDIATKADLATLRAELMNGQFIELNGAISELRTEVVATTRGEVLDAVTSQGRFLLLAFVAALAALAGLAFTLAQLG